MEEAVASQETLITGRNPLTLIGDDMFYVVCADGWTITERHFEDHVAGGLSFEPDDPDNNGASPVWFVGFLPSFPTGQRWLHIDAHISNGQEDRWESCGYMRIADHRTMLVWQWADRNWDDQLQRDVFSVRYWEDPTGGVGCFPGQDMTGRFALMSWNEQARATEYTPIAFSALSFWREVDGQLTALSPNNLFFYKTEEHEGCCNLYIQDFGDCLAKYTEATTEREYYIYISSCLPDIGFYDDGILDPQTGTLIPYDPEDADVVGLYQNALLANWSYYGENGTVYLVARDDTVLYEARENNSRLGVAVALLNPAALELPDGTTRQVSKCATVTLTGAHPMGDYLDLSVSGYWDVQNPANSGFENHGRGIRVWDETPRLVVRFTDWDNAGAFIPEDRGYDMQINAAPGEDRVVEVYLSADGEFTALDPREITVVSGNATLEYETGHRTDNSGTRPTEVEAEFLRVRFVDFEPFTLGWTDDNGTPEDETDDVTYTMSCVGELPNIGFYSPAIIDPQTNRIYDESNVAAWKAAYLPELNYDGTNGVVYLVARNGAWLDRVVADCDSQLDIAWPSAGGNVMVTLLRI
jgi:hypothetical protein